MIRRGESIPIHFHDGEPGGRHYTYVRNVAGHVVRLLIDATNSGDQYHWYAREALRGQEYITNDVLVQRIAALMEPCTVSFHAVVADDVRPGYDPRYARLSGDNWQPRVDVSTGLRQTVRWLSEQ
jgi:nucleoside-diphosphate-sugar epimerase